MSSRSTVVLGLVISMLGATAVSAEVLGTRVSYISPGSIEEQCVVLNRFPGGAYSEEDGVKEQAFCAIDFYSGNHALCPKLFSTSPGTLIYDISRGEFAGKAQLFESQQCVSSTRHKRGAQGEPVAYKMTVNGRNTSATFSTASLLYYHFSRYLNTAIHVPVSVYRSVDKDAHLERVIQSGLEASAHRKGGAMNHGGWEILRSAVEAPNKFHSANELLTVDKKQLYGVFLHPRGHRYSEEVNGTRASGWGKGQNRDFQETAPFLALRSEKPLLQAIDDGIQTAGKNGKLSRAMRHGISRQQMIFWMRELTEITFLDYIFSQQDRIGNIDYLNYWYWMDSGDIKRRLASGGKVPADLTEFHPIKLRRTQLNDNDAGGRIAYANFTRQTGMLEKIRHYNAAVYRRVMALAADFAEHGELYGYVHETFGLTDKQFKQLLGNTREAANILRETCRSGKLRFDLDTDIFLLAGKVEEVKLDCDKP